MAAKTANILARVEPEVKVPAEMIMQELGIPVSVVINMLYKQIILTKSIPFSLKLPTAPMSVNKMDNAAFDKIMQQGLDDALSNRVQNLEDAFADIEKGLRMHG